MTRSILALFALTLTLAACEGVETYPVSQCTTADHYPVACQPTSSTDHPGDLAITAAPEMTGA
ncbi:hypothetical protein [Celeribacter baekdonensis]|uniref:Lipoprotein n=1 Tax=Celeribacter baekdonensis TaxID=875171 RepID=A0A2R4M1Y4_9RHOB|nr:hypothetical protein [Celeribacter baekdonensis]AVW91210.1 hypothetical protein DA792_09055 [Celeribacter baekdonensis]|tara:strand:+ start:93267 stop:93455 length:189 start_codon:yes stop_codon:yes gene_type:complete